MNERATSFLVDMLISMFGYAPSQESADASIVPAPVKQCA
jgi:hypothetical protein